MKANELRIGNLIHIEGEIMTVKMIGETEVSAEGMNTDEYFISDVEPIQLTEEWLIKFGFRHPLNSCWYDIDGFEIDTDYGNFMYWLGNNKIDVNSVHQLQNLYFALTGEELELKEGE